MNIAHLLIGGFVVDLPICWLSWRFVIRPRLHRFVLDRIEQQQNIHRRLRPI